VIHDLFQEVQGHKITAHLVAPRLVDGLIELVHLCQHTPISSYFESQAAYVRIVMC
jgi:hypothetical protein